MVFTQETPSCVQWCKAARECLGPERYEKVIEALGMTDQRDGGR